MSSNEPRYDNISLDEAVLIQINIHLDAAAHSLLEGDFDSVSVNLDFAWRSLSPGLRAKVGERPSAQIRNAIYKRYRDAEIMRGDPNEELRQIRIVDDIVNNVHTKIVDTLDNAGLWISSRRSVVPTSQLKAKEQPPMSPVPARLPR